MVFSSIVAKHGQKRSNPRPRQTRGKKGRKKVPGMSVRGGRTDGQTWEEEGVRNRNWGFGRAEDEGKEGREFLRE